MKNTQKEKLTELEMDITFIMRDISKLTLMIAEIINVYEDLDLSEILDMEEDED